MRTHRLESEILVERPPEEVVRFFAEPRNLQAITPPWLHLEVLESTTPSIRAGTEIE